MNAVKIAKEYDIPMTASFHMQAENLTSYFKLNNVKFINTAVYKIIYKYVYQYVDKIHFPTKFIEEIFEHRAYGGKFARFGGSVAGKQFAVVFVAGKITQKQLDVVICNAFKVFQCKIQRGFLFVFFTT